MNPFLVLFVPHLQTRSSEHLTVLLLTVSSFCDKKQEDIKCHKEVL